MKISRSYCLQCIFFFLVPFLVILFFQLKVISIMKLKMYFKLMKILLS